MPDLSLSVDPMYADPSSGPQARQHRRDHERIHAQLAAMSGGAPADLVYVKTAQTAVGGTAAESVVASATLPAGTLTANRVLRAFAFGSTDNIATSGTLTLNVRLGGLTGQVLGTVILASSATAKTNQKWRLQLEVATRSVDGAGVATVMAGGQVGADFASVAATNSIGLALPKTIDSTVAQDLVVTAQWATGDPGNVARCELFNVTKS